MQKLAIRIISKRAMQEQNPLTPTLPHAFQNILAFPDGALCAQ